MWTTDFKYKISVIIPLYNAERYIKRCLDSILAIGLPEEKLEIIVVNDGSTDNGAAIVEEYTKKNSNIFIFHQENQGQSVARNLAISKAKGDYLWCVDSDDYILPEKFREVYDKLCEVEDLDIFSFEFYTQKSGESIKSFVMQSLCSDNTAISGGEAIIKGYLPASVCGFLVHREYFSSNNFSFYVGITHQDSELSYRMIANAEKIYFSNIHVYVYFENVHSTTKEPTPDKKFRLIRDDITVSLSFIELSRQIREQGEGMVADVIYNRAKSLQFSVVLQLFTNRKNYKKEGIYNYILSDLGKRNILPLQSPYNSWKHCLLSKVLNIYFKFR